MSLVGTRSAPFRFVVEAGKVREFARAVYDPTAEGEVVSIPVTFPVSGISDFERRFLFETLQLDRLRCLNAGQVYEYCRPLTVGDMLLCEAKVIEDYEKRGRRGGLLRFVVYEIEMREERSGTVVVISRSTTVETSSPE